MWLGARFPIAPAQDRPTAPAIDRPWSRHAAILSAAVRRMAGLPGAKALWHGSAARRRWPGAEARANGELRLDLSGAPGVLTHPRAHKSPLLTSPSP